MSAAEVDELPNERQLVDGRFASVGVADLDGRPEMFISMTAKVPAAHMLDAWIVPSDPALLRGLAGDLAAAADALDRL